MKRNERLIVALHMLLHMDQRPDRPMTSDEMAGHAGTNGAVIRRTLAGLRRADIVSSVKGHGGGWRLAKPPEQISLLAIQQALADAPAEASSEPVLCFIEQAVLAAVGGARRQAKAALDAELGSVTLANLLDEARARHAATLGMDATA